MLFPGHLPADDDIELPGPSSARRPRPWSPPAGVASRYGVQELPDFLRPRSYSPATHHHRSRRREASEVSVEALDLADYAQTLRRIGPEHDPYIPYHHTQPNPFSTPPGSPPVHTPSPPHRPFSGASMYPPPSLVSGESAATSRSSHWERRASLPPVLGVPEHYSRIARSHPIFAPGGAPRHSPSPARPESVHVQSSRDGDIDTRGFPRFAQGWYDSGSGGGAKGKEKEILFPDFSEPRRTPIYTPYYQPSAASTPGSGRDILPWSAEREGDAAVPESVKQERLRLLEREFLHTQPQREGDEEPELVDKQGRLITQGPKKRLAVRVSQLLLTALGGGAGFYGALVIKANPPAPPAGTVPAILLYVLAVLTLLWLLYLVVLRPCIVKPPKQEGWGAPGVPGGLFVLPVAQGAKKKKKGKKGQQVPGDVQVNLIVDPTAFGLGTSSQRGQRRRGEYSEVSGEDDAPQPPRRSVFTGLAMEAQWRAARSLSQKLLAADVVACVAWGAEFVYATFVGKHCPAGKFQGWCDAYNVALACACMLCVLFGASAVFDVLDLRGSRSNPRTQRAGA